MMLPLFTVPIFDEPSIGAQLPPRNHQRQIPSRKIKFFSKFSMFFNVNQK
jgi:hypothetical protein